VNQRTHLDNYAKIKKVPCPKCEAPIGGPCVTPKGARTFPHQERRHAAADVGLYVP